MKCQILLSIYIQFLQILWGTKKFHTQWKYQTDVWKHWKKPSSWAEVGGPLLKEPISKADLQRREAKMPVGNPERGATERGSAGDVRCFLKSTTTWKKCLFHTDRTGELRQGWFHYMFHFQVLILAFFLHPASFWNETCSKATSSFRSHFLKRGPMLFRYWPLKSFLWCFTHIPQGAIIVSSLRFGWPSHLIVWHWLSPFTLLLLFFRPSKCFQSSKM